MARTSDTITLSDTRYKDGEVFGPNRRQVSIANALNRFIAFEIGYGGHVSEVTDTKLTCTTYILSCRDEVSFEGSHEEMELLFEAAYLATTLQKSGSQDMQDVLVKRVMHYTKGSPIATTVTLNMMGVPEEEAAKLSNRKIEDLIAVMTLVRLDGYSLGEALTLIQ